MAHSSLCLSAESGSLVMAIGSEFICDDETSGEEVTLGSVFLLASGELPTLGVDSGFLAAPLSLCVGGGGRLVTSTVGMSILGLGAGASGSYGATSK